MAAASGVAGATGSPAPTVVAVRDPSGVWGLVEAGMARGLPLRDTQWKDPTGSFKVIRSLDLRFEQEPVQSAPFVSMLLFRCEDLEAFRRHRVLVDGFISDSNVQSQAWLVVMIAIGSSESQSINAGLSLARVRPSRRAFERLEAELGAITAGQNLGTSVLVEIFETTEDADRRQWDRLVDALKWCVIRTAERRSSEFEATARSLLRPTVQFAEYFALKERYSEFYENLTLADDALRQYDELDAFVDSHYQRVDCRALDGVCEDLPACPDWCALITASDPKPMQLSLDDSVLPDVFRSHIFSRQCRLLFRMRHPVQVCNRAIAFTRSVASGCSLQNRCMYVVTASTAVIHLCDDVVDVPQLDGLISQLLSFSLNLLERAGISLGFLEFRLERILFEIPSVSVVAASADAGSTPDSRSEAIPVTVPMLQSAFCNRDAFEKLYLSFASCVEYAFSSAGRNRFSVRVASRISTVLFRRGRLHRSLPLLLRDARSFPPGSEWASLCAPSLALAAQCQQLTKDLQGYIDSILELIRLPIHKEDLLKTVGQLFEEFIHRLRLFNESQVQFQRPTRLLVRITSAGLARQPTAAHVACSCDGFIGETLDIKLDVVSLSQYEFPIDSIRVIFESSASSSIVLDKCDVPPLAPGCNSISMSGFKPAVAGAYRVLSIQLFMAQLEFKFDPGDTAAAGETAMLPNIVIAARKATASLQVQLGSDPIRGLYLPVVCTISSGADELNDAHVRLQSHSQLSFADCDCLPATYVDGDDDRPLELSLKSGRIALPPCQPGSAIRIPLNVFAPDGLEPEHDLSTTLNYIADGSTLTVQSRETICFRDPLVLSSKFKVIRHKTFIQILLRCATSAAVELLSFDFQPGPFGFSNLNPSPAGQLVKPGIPYSLVFEIHESRERGPAHFDDAATFLDDDLDLSGKLRIQCRPVSVDDSQAGARFPVNLDFPVILKAPRHDVEYDVVISCGSRAALGEVLDFTVRLSKSQSSTSSALPVAYTIVVAEDSWIFSGRVHGRVVVSDSEHAVIQSKIIPVRCGYMRVPALELSQIVDAGAIVDVDPAKVRLQYDTQHVLVLPTGPFVSSVYEIAQDHLP
ncbi:TRAPP II complex TRAPPC10 C-terminal domain-containing protein [Plasmodiophora brassicae]|uniref:Trafficking protein particle complex subunit 11 domain-containing protein n=1 Tax=Plasmodiophora brassicae TaxID=37360 RepID=A0A0G4IL74_PLABS|nr:hypothetical protein PBRA_004560 [Plasmodiophora brassicae]SPR00126.1 unnamed protein product [Plasmodiophora brassicae]